LLKVLPHLSQRGSRSDREELEHLAVYVILVTVAMAVLWNVWAKVPALARGPFSHLIQGLIDVLRTAMKATIFVLAAAAALTLILRLLSGSLTRRTLASRRRLALLPSDSCQPALAKAEAFVAQLPATERVVLGWLDRGGRAVRHSLRSQGEGLVLATVEAPEAALGKLKTAYSSLDELEVRPAEEVEG
jgi:hypothetical protein